MDHSYTMTQWQDAPSTETPLSADNLNHIEQGIGAIYYEAGILEQLINQLLENRSHIGMIVMSTTLDTMEKVIEQYGGTTWVRITGRFLLGATPGESSDYPVSSTGGSRNAAIPSHTHVFDYTYETNSVAEGGTLRLATVDTGGYNFGQKIIKGRTKQTESTGVSGIGLNMPPYIAVYIWERTE